MFVTLVANIEPPADTLSDTPTNSGSGANVNSGKQALISPRDDYDDDDDDDSSQEQLEQVLRKRATMYYIEDGHVVVSSTFSLSNCLLFLQHFFFFSDFKTFLTSSFHISKMYVCFLQFILPVPSMLLFYKHGHELLMRMNVSLLQSRGQLYKHGHELLMRMNVSLLQSWGQL